MLDRYDRKYLKDKDHKESDNIRSDHGREESNTRLRITDTKIMQKSRAIITCSKCVFKEIIIEIQGVRAS